MQVSAKLRFLRMSPQKVRLVMDVIRGMRAVDAEHQLQFMNKAASVPMVKLLRSAMANAENNNELKRENLFVKSVFVDQGPTLKRWRPRAFGRAAEIRKRSSHITIILDEVNPSKKKTSKTTTSTKAADKKKKDDREVVDYKDIKHASKGPENKQDTKGEAAEGQAKQSQASSQQKVKEKFTRRLGEG